MRFSNIVLFCFLAAGSCAAQDGAVATPALGFAFDGSRGAIRPIFGMPGAALLSDPIDAGFPILSAAISPHHNFAIAASANSSLSLLLFQSSGVGLQSLDNAMTAPDRIIFSPTGRAALLYQNSGRLQTVSGLPDSPAVQEWSMPALAAVPAAIAISDDGALLVLSGGGDDSDPVWLLAADGSSSQLPLPGSTAALSFRGNSHDFLAVLANGDLYVVRNAGASADYRVLHFDGGGSSGPAAVRFSSNGTRAYTATSSGNLSVIDLDSGSIATVSCGCSADRLEPLKLPNLFRVTSASSSPLMLFDVSASAPRVWFVPPAVSGNSGGGVR
jgi:hypothetical protein